MSARVTWHIKLWLTKKKSSLHWISGFFLRQVYLSVLEFRTLHASMRSSSAMKSFNVLNDLVCVLGRPPFLSFSISKTKLKSPPIIRSSHWKSRRWSKKSWKKPGSSSLGAYRVAKVMYFPSDLTSQIINLPFTSEYVRRIWKQKLLLKRMATPPFALEQQLKSDLYPHSADQVDIVSSLQCTSCRK